MKRIIIALTFIFILCNIVEGKLSDWILDGEKFEEANVIEFKGRSDAPVSGVNNGRLYFDSDDAEFYISKDGASYVLLGSSTSSGNFDGLSLDGDAGTAEELTNTDTITIAGGTGIDTNIAATDTITVAIDSTVVQFSDLSSNATLYTELALFAEDSDLTDFITLDDLTPTGAVEDSATTLTTGNDVYDWVIAQGYGASGGDASLPINLASDLSVTDVLDSTHIDQSLNVANLSLSENIYIRGGDVYTNAGELGTVGMDLAVDGDIGCGNLAAVSTIMAIGAGSFATVNTGQGANELYAMNQDVQTTDNVTFNDLYSAGDIEVDGDGFFSDSLTVANDLTVGTSLWVAGTGEGVITLKDVGGTSHNLTTDGSSVFLDGVAI